MRYLKEYKDIDWDDWDEEEVEPISNMFKGYEKFYNFLDTHDIVEKFKNELYIQNKITIDKYLKRYVKSFNYEIINYAFTWDNTSDGKSYWSDIDNEWHVYLDKLNNGI